MSIFIEDVIKPDGFDKNGPYYKKRNVNDLIMDMIITNNYFIRKAKKMSKDYDTATDIICKSQKKFDNAIEKLVLTQEKISAKTKKVSENVRLATSKLNEGLARIEKQANFDRLERYVELLERAEKSIIALSELERAGILEKIAKSLR